MNFLLKDIGNNHHQTGIDKIINKVMKQIININRILVDFQIKEDQILEIKEIKEIKEIQGRACVSETVLSIASRFHCRQSYSVLFSSKKLLSL